MPLLIILVVYVGRYTQDMTGRQNHQKVEGVLLLIPEIGNSFG